MSLKLLLSEGGSASSRFYYYEAIDNMASIVEDWENRILAKLPNAAKDFEAFKDGKRTEARNIMSHAIMCTQWVQNRAVAKSVQAVELRRMRKQQ